MKGSGGHNSVIKRGFCCVLILAQLAAACAAGWCGFRWVIPAGWLTWHVPNPSVAALFSLGSPTPLILDCGACHVYSSEFICLLGKDVENDNWNSRPF